MTGGKQSMDKYNQDKSKRKGSGRGMRLLVIAGLAVVLLSVVTFYMMKPSPAEQDAGLIEEKIEEDTVFEQEEAGNTDSAENKESTDNTEETAITDNAGTDSGTGSAAKESEEDKAAIKDFLKMHPEQKAAMIEAAEKAVSAYESAAVKTADEINMAVILGETASYIVEMVGDIADKESLMERIKAKDAAVLAANGTKPVTTAETASSAPASKVSAPEEKAAEAAPTASGEQSAPKNVQQDEAAKPAEGTAAAKLKVGSYVLFGSYLGEAILWKVADIGSSGAMLVSEHILCLKPFDAAESGQFEAEGGSFTEDKETQKWGSNKWSNSNLREWLNSSAQKVAYTTQPPTESAVKDGENDYAEEPGFLSGFSQNERNAIMAINHGGTTDKVYLLSEAELSKLGKRYEDRLRKPTEKAVSNSDFQWDNNLEPQKSWWYWLRTPYGGTKRGLLGVNKDGATGYFTAGISDGGVLPVLNLKPDTNIAEGDGTAERPYVMR